MAAYVQTQGGLIVPASFAEPDQEKPVGRPVLDDVATTRDGRDITRGYVDPMMLLQPQDSVLRLRGSMNYQLYKEVLRDDQVKTAFEQRQRAVVSREWEVMPGGDRPIDQEAADYAREQLKAINFDAATDKMLYGIFYGYGVAEVLWARKDNRVVIDQVRVRDRSRFAFDGAMRLRLKTMSNPMPGEEVPDRKFWHFANGADHDDEPYGLGLAHWLYWPVFFKRGGIRLWMTFLDKFGAPTVKGEYPTNATPAEKTKLLNALEAVSSESGVIIPEGMAIELLEAARTGSASYEKMYDRMDKAIAKVIIGQVGSTEGTPGQLGDQESQGDVRADLVKADADIICSSFNRTVLRWLTEFNFPGAMPPMVWRKMEEEEDLTSIAKRDKTLADIGYRPTEDRIRDVYGDGYEYVPPQTPPSLPPSFAEPAQRDSTDDIDQMDTEAEKLAANWERLLGRRVNDIIAMAEDTNDLEIFRERLRDIAAADPDDQVVDEFRKLGFIARLWGRWRAGRGRDQ